MLPRPAPQRCRFRSVPDRATACQWAGNPVGARGLAARLARRSRSRSRGSRPGPGRTAADSGRRRWPRRRPAAAAAAAGKQGSQAPGPNQLPAHWPQAVTLSCS